MNKLFSKLNWKFGLALLIGLGVCGLSSELLMRLILPQEVNGWGERLALQKDKQFSWKMRPGAHHLRWDYYDYKLEANSLGFPGPEYPVKKNPQTLRVLVTGDAFSSAEGVDTNQSWVRLLEKKLAAQYPDRQVEVMNFAITGYGPNQYLATLKEFAPRYQPDLIVSEFFVNDFEDVMYSDADFHESIGFDKRSPHSFVTLMKLGHVQQWFKHKVKGPTIDRIKGRPSPAYGYFLAHFSMFSPKRDSLEASRQKVATRIQQMAQVAQQVGAKMVIPMVPSSVQVCQAKDLAYYPSNVDLKKYDLELPQQLMQSIVKDQGITMYDLRSPLKQLSRCPYHPRNMHWLPSGHEAVAKHLVQQLRQDQLLP